MKDIYVRQGVAAVVVEIGRVDIKDKFAVVGGIRLQAAHGNGSSGFQLGEQVSAAGGWIFEVDVPCGALWDNVRIPIAVLFTLIVLLGVADGLVRNGEISDACAVNAIVSCQRAADCQSSATLSKKTSAGDFQPTHFLGR